MPLFIAVTLPAPKRSGKAFLQLRREIDLGHHHQGLRLRVARQQALHGMQIDLGLAAARGPEKQEGSAARFESSQGQALLRRQFGRAVRWLCGCGVGRTLQPPGQLDSSEVAQLRRQRRERNFAQSALVVTRSRM